MLHEDCWYYAIDQIKAADSLAVLLSIIVLERMAVKRTKEWCEKRKEKI